MANPKKNYKSKSSKKTSAAKPDAKNSAKTNATASSVPASSALLNAAANISFPTTAGYTVDLFRDNAPLDVISHNDMSLNIPGVLRMGYVPTMGPMRSWTDPANVWIRDVYTYIRHVNSGHTNYDAAALGTYFFAYRSAMDYLYWMQRLYGVMMGAYVPANAYAPRDIVKACGGDYSDLLHNMANLRFYITSFATRLNQMRVPELGYFTQAKTLLSNIYADSETNKASFYVFDPDGFWRARTGTTPETTYLYLDRPDSGRYGDVAVFGEEILNELLNSEDFNIMSGDIMKAYNSYAPIGIIEEGFTIAPVFDGAMLWVIHNANALYGDKSHAVNALNGWAIKQNLTEGSEHAGALVLDATAPFLDVAPETHGNDTLVAACMDALIDLPYDIPDAGMVGAVTRFKVMGHAEVSAREPDTVVVRIDSMQAEVLTSFSYISTPGGDLWDWDINGLHAISRFDMHPYLYSYAVTPGDGTVQVNSASGGIIGEITNFTKMTLDVKKNIDMAMMLDLFSQK